MMNRAYATTRAICGLLCAGIVATGISCAAGRPPSPQITFTRTLLDLGEVGPGTETTCSFSFTNTGSGNLTVQPPRASCGCVAGRMTKTTFSPGESGAVEITFTAPATARNKVVERSIMVPSNDPTAPVTQLHVRASVMLPVEVIPSELTIDLNAANAEPSALTLRSKDGTPFEMSHCRISANVMTMFNEPGSGPAGELVVRPQLNRARLESLGLSRGRIYLYLTHPRCSAIVVPFRVQYPDK